MQETWKFQNKKLLENEENENAQRRQIQKQISDFNRKRAEEKKLEIEQRILREYEEAEQLKNGLDLEKKEFYSYTEKCVREWESQGKNVTPLLLEMKKHKDFLIKHS